MICSWLHILLSELKSISKLNPWFADFISSWKLVPLKFPFRLQSQVTWAINLRWIIFQRDIRLTTESTAIELSISVNTWTSHQGLSRKTCATFQMLSLISTVYLCQQLIISVFLSSKFLPKCHLSYIHMISQEDMTIYADGRSQLQQKHDTGVVKILW